MKELLIPLDSHLKKPLYEQICTFIKEEIRNGRIPACEKLPSSRALARQLSVSRSTVDLAYAQLSSEGYLESIPCKGFYAGDFSEMYHLEPLPESIGTDRGTARPEYAVDFDVTGIARGGFPLNIWRKLSRNVLAGGGEELFQPGDPRGEPGLREAIAGYLHHARGVNCGPEQIVIGAGNDYLLMLLSVLLGRERPIAMENPTYKTAYDCFRSLGHPVRAVRLDENGMDPEALEASRAGVAYVMPSHQFPMGMVMPLRRRIQLLSWAAEAEDRYLIEDDYDSEFRYRGKPVPALQGYDQRGRVIYLGTFSKSLAPSIRISYMVLPEKLLPEYEKKGKCFSATVSRTDQKILERFIREGYFERHLNRMRAVYRNRHDQLIRQLRQMQEFCTVEGENAGLHVLLWLQGGLREKEAVRKAREEGIRIRGLSEYDISGLTPERSQAVLLGYGTLEEEEIQKGCAGLRKAWRSG
jgi:GntR family transcriptional regulator/MocR family aminotransferase